MRSSQHSNVSDSMEKPYALTHGSNLGPSYQFILGLGANSPLNRRSIPGVLYGDRLSISTSQFILPPLRLHKSVSSNTWFPPLDRSPFYYYSFSQFSICFKKMLWLHETSSFQTLIRVTTVHLALTNLAPAAPRGPHYFSAASNYLNSGLKLFSVLSLSSFCCCSQLLRVLLCCLTPASCQTPSVVSGVH